MTNAIPLNNEEKQPDRAPGDHAANVSGAGQLRQEYTNEEVSEIIRVALQGANGGNHSTVNQEEMLAIAGEFGLSPADLIRASEAIAASKEETDRSSKAKEKAKKDFRLHLICYVAGIVGLFLLNWVLSPEYWWFILATIAYGPVVVVHGFIARSDPDLALSVLRPESFGPSKGEILDPSK